MAKSKTNPTHKKNEDFTTRTPLKTCLECRCPEKVRIFYSNSVTRSDTLVENLVISHEIGKRDGIMTTWSSVTQIFRKV